jgi:hypothetical protein
MVTPRDSCQVAAFRTSSRTAKAKGSLAYNAMARKKIPVVEVTAPDGTKSFWGVYDQAVAAVRTILPAKYTVELSLRRLPPEDGTVSGALAPRKALLFLAPIRA